MHSTHSLSTTTPRLHLQHHSEQIRPFIYSARKLVHHHLQNTKETKTTTIKTEHNTHTTSNIRFTRKKLTTCRCKKSCLTARCRSNRLLSINRIFTLRREGNPANHVTIGEIPHATSLSPTTAASQLYTEKKISQTKQKQQHLH